jgi:hypothetical protein
LAIEIVDEISSANREAVEKMIDTDPLLVDVDSAYKIIPNYKERLILHAGPPIEWKRMCGAQKGAVIGAILFERWCDTPEEAKELASSGEVLFDSCHHHSAVGPMAGVISPSMPIFVVKASTGEGYSYTNFNEGLGRALRFGAYDQNVLGRLGWMRDTLAPVLREVLRAVVKEKGGIRLRSIISQALQMGDECHNRNQAGTSLFLREIVPYLMSLEEKEKALESYRFINGNDHFFLNLVLAASKCMADAAHNIKYSTIVTAIARNGTDVGIRVSGLGDKWFVDGAPVPDGLYFPGYSAKDANPDMGDSTITETVGLGGAAMAASPSIVKFVGGNASDALEMTSVFKQITLAQHRHFTIPYMDFEGTPVGIDFRKVIRSGFTPRANTGIAHKYPGVGQIGAGIVTLPMVPFKKALREYVSHYGI